jgi:hypothetical protein
MTNMIHDVELEDEQIDFEMLDIEDDHDVNDLEWYDSYHMDQVPDEVLLYAYDNILNRRLPDNSIHISDIAKVNALRDYIDSEEFRAMARLVEYLR